MYFESKCVSGYLGSSKVVDFDASQKCICDLLLVISSNLGRIFHHF